MLNIIVMDTGNTDKSIPNSKTKTLYVENPENRRVSRVSDGWLVPPRRHDLSDSDHQSFPTIDRHAARGYHPIYSKNHSIFMDGWPQYNPNAC